MQGLIGRKVGMTQVYDGDGKRVAVTVIQAGPCVVVQRKTARQDGYDAVQLGFDEQKEHRVPRPQLARFKKAGVAPQRTLREFRCDAEEGAQAGDSVGVAIFDGVGYVNVIGTTKGRGFAGVVRRHGMGGGPMTHGGHSKRRVGSIGQCAFPSRVAKNRRMPGHMGNVRVTQENLQVIQVRGEDNVILVKGAVPGPTGGVVLVTKSIKKAGRSA